MEGVMQCYLNGEDLQLAMDAMGKEAECHTFNGTNLFRNGRYEEGFDEIMKARRCHALMKYFRGQLVSLGLVESDKDNVKQEGQI